MAWRAIVLLMPFLLLLSACGQSSDSFNILVSGKAEEMTEEQVLAGIRRGALGDTSMVWSDGQWKLFKDDARTLALLAAARTPAPASSVPPASPPPAAAATRMGVAEMTFTTGGFPMGLSTGQSDGFCFFGQPEQGMKILPSDLPKSAVYGTIAFAGRSFLAIMVEGASAKFYLDANGNGDLTDDSGPFRGGEGAILPNLYHLEIPYDDGPAPYDMWFFESRMGCPKFYAKSYWVGKVPAGEALPMVVFDANADADHSNDALVIDIDRDGEADENEAFKVGQEVVAPGVRMTLDSISPSGRTVKFRL